MKTVVILACIFTTNIVVFGSFIDDLSNLWNLSDDLVNNCAVTCNLTTGDDKKIEKNDLSEEESKKLSQKLDCTIQCAMQNSSLIKDNELQIDVMHEMMNERFNKTDDSPAHERLNECIQDVKSIMEGSEFGSAVFGCFVDALTTND